MTAPVSALERFADISVKLSVELGRTQMPLKSLLALGEGSIVALDRLTDELLDVTANGQVVARGEVIAQNGRFALRIVTMVGDDEGSADVEDDRQGPGLDPDGDSGGASADTFATIAGDNRVNQPTKREDAST
ncbi:MAG: flagellar motor switch protein FliN [Erythrobacter sp.]